MYKSYPKIKKKAEVLILAGDIGKINNNIYTEFMNYINKTWEKTFYILGNHEFYHNKKTHLQLEYIYDNFFNDFENIILMKPDKIYQYENFNFIGCTLWSYAMKKFTNCFKKIKYYNKEKKIKENITLDYYNNLYFEHKNKLLSKIKDNIIVITHYPVIDFNVRHSKYSNQTEEEKKIFSNNLDLKCKNCVFISGHTHYSFDFNYNGNRFISNQFGYPNKINETRLKTDGLFEIK